MLRRFAAKGYADAMVLDYRGQVAEATGASLSPPALHAPCLLIVVPITFYPQTQGEIAYCVGVAGRALASREVPGK
ncbi:hypothetical protein ELI38_15985 [Rhizobium leguminosarum]|nr:hypothetical protein ELI38_15985 [Rhizobium leguminosarum]TBZ92119.1 hypothetical protein E0H56_17005 [Rhizobium leguminosarum bv. viciae]TAW52965.1 hypothetical protein ELI14_17465 [Rhizobium leguminosarum]TAY38392.1 hypothetical protein ELH89_15320 [Rhizobium leguminosarum]TBE55753.1 hypothetical protein ELH04_15605 [Rhizobium leguminosarum]